MSSSAPAPAAQATADPTDFADVLAAADGFAAGDEVDCKARLLLLDSLGCIAAGLTHETVRVLAGQLAVLHPGPLRLPGADRALGPAGIAALAAAALCWDEACEGLAMAHGRPGVAAVPVALALAAGPGVTVGGLIGALVAGYEVGGRAGQLWRIRPGMHVDGSWHSLGAAVTAARLLGADRAAQLAAARIAACQVPFSLYRPIEAGSVARNTYPAHAASLGLLAGAAAAAGIDAPADALAVARRLALGHVAAGERAPAGRHLILEGYLKPFAAVRHVHYAAAAALGLREKLGGETRSIRGLTLSIYEEAIRYCGNRDPSAPIQAQFSLSYGLAAALVLGDLGPAAYGAAMHDPEIRRLERLVRIEPDRERSAAGRRGATLHAETTTCLASESADSVPGDPDNPMTEADALAKFHRYAGPVLGEAAAERLAASVLGTPWDRPAGPAVGIGRD